MPKRKAFYVNPGLYGQSSTPKILSIALWIVQALLALFFISTGVLKLITSIVKIATMWPWAGESPTLLRFTGVVDLLGGIGIIVPSLTRIKPGLTVLATLGCALLIVSAIISTCCGEKEPTHPLILSYWP